MVYVTESPRVLEIFDPMADGGMVASGFDPCTCMFVGERVTAVAFVDDILFSATD